jgi:hypothetical protein
MSGQIVPVESADDVVAALRERGLDGSAAHRLVQDALVAAAGRTDLGAVYRLYVLAAAVAAATAFLFVSL